MPGVTNQRELCYVDVRDGFAWLPSPVHVVALTPAEKRSCDELVDLSFCYVDIIALPRSLL